MGNDCAYSVAWRQFDAQYWGVPQRRKRIYLVADFAGGSAGDILFESEGLSRYTPQGFRAWERTARYPEKGIGAADGADEGLVLCDQGGERMDVLKGITAPLRAEAHHPPVVLEAAGFCTEQSAKTRSIGYEEETSPTLRAGVVPAAVAVAYGLDRAAYNQGRNALYDFAVEKELIPTMVAKGPGAVAQPTFSASKASFFTEATEETANCLVATDYKDPPIVNDEDGVHYIVRRLTPTECAKLQGFPDWWCADLGTEHPTSEEAYEWFKIFETHRELVTHAAKPKTEKQIIKWLQNPHSDAAEYKMWGNGVALPCVYFVLSGVVWAKEEK